MNPYAHADKANKELRSYIGAQFQNLSLMPFDEINARTAKRNVGDAYKRIYVKCLTVFLAIAVAAYQEACARAGKKPSVLPKAAFIAAILSDYNPLTQFVYVTEWERKRDRTAEAMLSCENRMALRRALKVSKSVTVRQVDWYTDIITDESMVKGYHDSGVKRVKWITQRDGHVCEICLMRDGKIYPIDKIPTKPHRGCRCYTIPIKEKEV